MVPGGWGLAFNRMADAEMERLLVKANASRPILPMTWLLTGPGPTVAEAGQVMGKRPIQAVRLTQRPVSG